MNWLTDYSLLPSGPGSGQLEEEPPIAIAEVAAPVGEINQAVFAQAQAERQTAQGLLGNINDALKVVRAWVL